MADATIFRWIDTTGGPLILIPEPLAPLWEGVFGPTDGRTVEVKIRYTNPKYQPATDYDLACNATISVEGWLGVIPVGNGQAVILDTEGAPAFWWAAPTVAIEGYIISGVYDGESVIRDRILERLPTLPYEPDGTEFVFDVGPLHLFDSTSRGDDTEFEEPEERLIMPLPGGRYLARTCYLKSNEDEVTLIIHHLRRI